MYSENTQTASFKNDNVVNDNLFSPLNFETFIKEIYGKHHYIFQGDSDRFKHLLSWSDLDEVLNTQRLSFPRFRLAKGGEILEEGKYLKVIKADKGKAKRVQLNNAALYETVSSGATVIVDAVNEIFPQIADFAESFEHLFSSTTQANAYFAKSEQNGFKTHWDTHDVFAIQIKGRKYWRIYGSTRINPLKDEKKQNNIPPNTPPIWEGMLESGEMLYIPRGCWHDANAMGEESIHISVGVHRARVFDFVKKAVNEARASVLVRSNIPLYRNKKTINEYQKKIAKEVQKYMEKEDLLYDYLVKGDRDVFPRAFNVCMQDAINPNTNLSAETKIRLATRRKYIVETLDNGDKCFHAMKKKWKFPEEVFEVIELLMEERFLYVEDIEFKLSKYGYSIEEIHAFIFDLLKKGLFIRKQ